MIDGTWYVADSGGSRVVTVNPATGAVDPVATSGLTDPRDLEQDAADPAALWVTDTGGNRIVRISRTDGEQLATLTGLTQPYGLANDEDRVYAANTYDNSVRAYNRDGSTAWTQTTCGGEAFSRPRDVGLADDGHVVVADTDNDRLAVLDPADGSCVRTFGNRGTAAGQFKAPRSVSADGDGGLWVADALNYRVQHLTMTGGSLGATPVDAYGDGPQQFRSPHCVTRSPAAPRWPCATRSTSGSRTPALATADHRSDQAPDVLEAARAPKPAAATPMTPMTQIHVQRGARSNQSRRAAFAPICRRYSRATVWSCGSRCTHAVSRDGGVPVPRPGAEEPVGARRLEDRSAPPEWAILLR